MHFLIFISLFLSVTKALLVFDLSHDLNNKTLGWQNLTQFKLIPTFKGYVHPELPENDEKNHWLETNDVSGAEHSGTHLDAPSHIVKNQWTVDQIPPDRFFGPVSIVDLRGKVKENPDYQITENDLIEWEKVNKKKLDPLIILWTGWASRWPDRLRYLGSESEYDASFNRFPGLSRGAADWLAKELGEIHGIGIDTPSPDYGQSTLNYAHRILFQKKVFFIENLNTKNLESFPMVPPYYLSVNPLKITGGSGSPVRVLLISHLPEDLSMNKSNNYKGNSSSRAHIHHTNRIGLITVVLLLLRFFVIPIF